MFAKNHHVDVKVPLFFFFFSASDCHCYVIIRDIFKIILALKAIALIIAKILFCRLSK